MFKSASDQSNFLGSIDEVKITGNSTSDLRGYWNFDENNGTSAKDSSRYGRNGVVNNAGWVEGTSGSALQFRGNDDSYVEVMNAPQLTPETELTLEMDIKPESLMTPAQCQQTAEDWFNKGCALNAQGKHDEAIKVFDEAIRLDPNDAAAWTSKGDSLYGQGRFDEAIKAFDEAIRLDTNDSVAWYIKGNALSDLRKYDEAIKAFDEAIRLDPTNTGAWNNKGVAFNAQGKHDEAIKACDEAIRLDTNHAATGAALGNKGSALISQGKYDDAIKTCDEAIRLDPSNFGAWSNKGTALRALGRTTEADAAFTKAKELENNS